MKVDDGAWSRLARFGPFFAVDPRPDLRRSADWRPLIDLTRPEVLRERAAVVGTALAAGLPPGLEVPVRVAASVSQLGLCARLSAVTLGASVDGLTVPPPDRWSYVDRLGGPYPVGLRPQLHAEPPWPTMLLAAVGPIARATVTTFALSPQVVWGNVASGLTGAAGMIAAAEPDLAASVERRLAQALATPELSGSMVTDGAGGHRRRSCCLIYRLSGSTSAVCGDCVLAG